ncbi:GPW/gp25 family protein [Acidimicrobium ferrooxidans DSM 10331]|uniref:GPW/gp25 family protein n=1 Tax=Acidimicrobium ferrooxidans (strain DSM 10331 / JCM 15462 / NBRC 103882 / ICP) TaxID=525909 RepID=C7M034_ACIFD|nr:GPW/gp25 family protein [Acidimicrobium ferrooxidans]ACU54342.1 GPW/gp25 family protein [Acidimicrobium ferrooxidans DSM 10331]
MATREHPTDASVSDPGFVGRGFAFPMRVDVRGGIALSDGTGSTDTAIRVVISTAPGERVMRPAFGCRIWDLLFEPVNANTMGLMAQAVREALAQWEPRIDVENVAVAQDDNDASLVHITVTYRLRATNDRRNLVYPFYTIPREEG